MDTDKKKNSIKAMINSFLEEGLCKRDAALMAGISEATFHRWIKEDESFESQVEASILKYKQSLIQMVNTMAMKDGRLALKILALRYPKEWGENAGLYQEEEKSKSNIEKLVASMDKLLALPNDEKEEDATPYQSA